MVPQTRTRAPRNRTISCNDEELAGLTRQIAQVTEKATLSKLSGRLVAGDFFEVAPYFPPEFVDLLILDPPYNLLKDFNGNVFRRKEEHAHRSWFARLIDLVIPMLKANATIYVCSDWKTSVIVYPVLKSRFRVRNRITWEREKGRGAKENWKNNTEDIWFCTKSDAYFFDVEAVKLKRRVIAPYRLHGKPKDWREEKAGNYRMTHPSNVWTDLTVPFWSMPENTDHPTQKPEKLIAKLVLASSKKGDFVFDPFIGSGTTAVVAQKLGRQWCGVDVNAEYLCWALKRIAAAKEDPSIQGYVDGIFWERNSLSGQKSSTESSESQSSLKTLSSTCRI